VALLEDLEGALSAGELCGVATNLTTLFLGCSTPDACVLVGLEGELEAINVHGALATNRLGFCNLQECLTGGPYWEKQFRISISTSGLVTPGVVGASKSER
jgi:hypothetical protein